MVLIELQALSKMAIKTTAKIRVEFIIWSPEENGNMT